MNIGITIGRMDSASLGNYLDDIRADLAELNAIFGNKFDAERVHREQSLGNLFKAPLDSLPSPETVNFESCLEQTDAMLDRMMSWFQAKRAQKTTSYLVTETQLFSKRTTGTLKSTASSRLDSGKLSRVLNAKENTSVVILTDKSTSKEDIASLLDKLRQFLVAKYQKSKQEKIRLMVHPAVLQKVKCHCKLLRNVNKTYREIIVTTEAFEALISTVFSLSEPEFCLKIDKRLVAVMNARPGVTSNESQYIELASQFDLPSSETPETREVVFLNMY